MSLFALADTHLSLGSDKPMAIFGQRWNGHEEKLRKNWNAVVDEDDVVVVPGDISWGMTLEEAYEDLKFLDALNGTKIISKGNHDLWWASKTKNDAFFEKNGIKSIYQLHNNAFIYENYMICGSRGWFNDEKAAPKDTDYQKIVTREIGRMKLSVEAGKKLCAEEGVTADEILMFLHFPPVFRDYVCTEIVDALHELNVKRCYFGHIHGVYDVPMTREYEGICFTMVSADYLKFTPCIIY